MAIKLMQSAEDWPAEHTQPCLLVESDLEEVQMYAHWFDGQRDNNEEMFIPRTAEWLETLITALQAELSALQEGV